MYIFSHGRVYLFISFNIYCQIFSHYCRIARLILTVRETHLKITINKIKKKKNKWHEPTRDGNDLTKICHFNLNFVLSTHHNFNNIKIQVIPLAEKKTSIHNDCHKHKTQFIPVYSTDCLAWSYLWCTIHSEYNESVNERLHYKWFPKQPENVLCLITQLI